MRGSSGGSRHLIPSLCRTTRSGSHRPLIQREPSSAATRGDSGAPQTKRSIGCSPRRPSLLRCTCLGAAALSSLRVRGSHCARDLSSSGAAITSRLEMLLQPIPQAERESTGDRSFRLPAQFLRQRREDCSVRESRTLCVLPQQPARLRQRTVSSQRHNTRRRARQRVAACSTVLGTAAPPTDPGISQRQRWRCVGCLVPPGAHLCRQAPPRLRRTNVFVHATRSVAFQPQVHSGPPAGILASIVQTGHRPRSTASRGAEGGPQSSAAHSTACHHACPRAQ
jgi:hypothetical protein